MKDKLNLLAIAILFHATSSWALPMQSTAGSGFTGDDTGGALYSVMFGGGGVAGAVFVGEKFDSALEAEANTVSPVMVAALNSNGSVLHEDISGCGTPVVCLLFNPDSYRLDVDYADRDFILRILSTPETL